MASVCFYFQVHQPYRLRRYSVFDTDRHYFDAYQNAEACRKAARECYGPANTLLLEMIQGHAGRFRVAFSVTGVAMEQLREHAPEVVEGFQELNETGCVEFLDETYYHSLSFLYSREEFREQVSMQRAMLRELFGQEPRVFRNTELMYGNDLAHFLSHLGYAGVLGEGSEQALGHRSPNYVYGPPHAKLKLLLRDTRLSDALSARFADRTWEHWPVTPEKVTQWVNEVTGRGYVVNLFLKYELLGDPRWLDAGGMDFLRRLPGEVMKSSRENNFITPAQACDAYEPVGEADVPQMTSWIDPEHDLSAWLGNAMQSNALHELYKLEGPLREKNDPQLLSDWRRLTSSDHFYYMGTRHWAEGDAQKQVSPYESPYDSYINFMNVLDSMQSRLRG